MQAPRPRRFWAAALGAGLAVLAAQLSAVAPVEASTLPLGSVKVLEEQSPFDNSPVKTFSAHCAAGQRVLGGGALTVGGAHAVITEMQPIHPATGVDTFEVTAAADQFGIPNVWSFQAFAFCAVVPASMELEIIAKTNPPTSSTDQVFTQCSPGKRLIGTGGKIDNGAGQVDLGTIPDDPLFGKGSFATAMEDPDGYAGLHTLTGYSVCAKPTLFTDFAEVSTVVESDPGQSSVRQDVTCPAGMALTGLAGQAEDVGTHLQFIRPGPTANIATFATQAVPPPSAQFFMAVTAFCAQ